MQIPTVLPCFPIYYVIFCIIFHLSVNSISWYSNYIPYIISHGIGPDIVSYCGWYGIFLEVIFPDSSTFITQSAQKYSDSVSFSFQIHIFIPVSLSLSLSPSSSEIFLWPLKVVRQQGLSLCIMTTFRELIRTLIKSQPVHMGRKHNYLLVPSALSLLCDLLSYLIHSFMLWLSQVYNKGLGWFSTEKHRTAAKCSTA